MLQSVVINGDETPVRMLKPGWGKTITGYVSGFAGDADHRYVFYDFRPSRSRDGPAEALPILARMKARFEEVRPTLRPKSKLAEAID